MCVFVCLCVAVSAGDVLVSSASTPYLAAPLVGGVGAAAASVADVSLDLEKSGPKLSRASSMASVRGCGKAVVGRWGGGAVGWWGGGVVVVGLWWWWWGCGGGGGGVVVVLVPWWGGVRPAWTPAWVDCGLLGCLHPMASM